MKNYKLVLFFVLLAAAGFVGFRAVMATEWTIVAEDVSITFEGKNAKGSLTGLDADITFSPSDLANSRFKATLQTKDLDLGNGLQTKHANSDNWMDTEKYPTISFTSREIRVADTGYEVVGDLDMHGVTREIVMPFTFEETEAGGIFKGSMHIVRDDFNIGKGKYVPEVDVRIEVPVRD